MGYKLYVTECVNKYKNHCQKPSWTFGVKDEKKAIVGIKLEIRSLGTWIIFFTVDHILHCIERKNVEALDKNKQFGFLVFMLY